MIVGSTNKESDVLTQDLVITRCQIYTNGENGVTVLDFARGTVLIEHCRVYENYHNGLYFLQSKDAASAPPKADQVAPHLDRGTARVQHCEIARNRQYGVTLSMIRCYISDTAIVENGDGAVSLDERSKQLLKFETKSETEQVRDLVQGSIGGDWGLLYPEKRGLCGRSSCHIF